MGVFFWLLFFLGGEIASITFLDRIPSAVSYIIFILQNSHILILHPVLARYWWLGMKPQHTNLTMILVHLFTKPEVCTFEANGWNCRGEKEKEEREAINPRGLWIKCGHYLSKWLPLPARISWKYRGTYVKIELNKWENSEVSKIPR